MDFAVQKTIELLLIIALGVFLQRKLPQKESLGGVKTLILSVALPATIFLALLKIKLDSSLITLPVMAFGFNIAMLLAVRYLLPLFMDVGGEDHKKTLQMLLPSLAPGLSAFPFIVTYLGDDHLALAALADVGNKVFGLILLYLLAMYWYRKSAKLEKTSNKNKIKSLLLALVNEPINIVIVVALAMLSFGLDINAFPGFLQGTITRLSVLMVPLVLLFIGMAVRIKFSELRYIFGLLTWRAGATFVLAGLVLLAFPGMGEEASLLLIVFPLSSCSFWPFAHMSAVRALEEKDGQQHPIFNLDFAVSILACSLPYSTILIIGVFHFGDEVAHPWVLLPMGVFMVVSTLLPKALRVFQKKRAPKEVTA